MAKTYSISQQRELMTESKCKRYQNEQVIETSDPGDSIQNNRQSSDSVDNLKSINNLVIQSLSSKVKDKLIEIKFLN